MLRSQDQDGISRRKEVVEMPDMNEDAWELLWFLTDSQDSQEDLEDQDDQENDH